MVDVRTLEAGHQFEPFEFVPDMETVVRYCGLAGALAPLFYDVEGAKAAGMPGTIVPGMLKTWILHRALETWLGDGVLIRHLRTAHRRPDLTAARMTVVGTVTQVFEVDGEQRADIEVASLDAGGQPTVRGFATVAAR